MKRGVIAMCVRASVAIMRILKKHLLVFRNGEQSFLSELEDGSFACPICGEPWPHECPPYFPNRNGRFATPNNYLICDGCNVEFGVDEGAAPLSWIFHRIAWLNRVGWNAQSLQQLSDHLEIDDARLKQELNWLEEARKRRE